MAKVIGKLVRDKIVEIIEAAGGKPRWRRLTGDQTLLALNHKLQEEHRELLMAKKGGRKAQTEELADLLEVVRALAHERGIPWKNVEAARERKQDLRGGFSKRIFLERVE